MKRKHVKRSIVFVVITLYVLVVFGEGYADVDVTLVVNPKSTEVYAGSGKIVITADASGENLAFTWKLSGPGKLEDEGPAAFYIPPEKIEQTSEFAIVTVTVKEPSRKATIKSVTFTILPSPAETATPSSESTLTEKKGMSRGTKVALGVGAVAALGGGIALAVGGGDDSEPAPPCVTECAGVMVGCYCWYLGAKGQSCDPVCVSHGGYHEATRTFAGSQGTDSNCYAVLSALGAPPPDRGRADSLDWIGLGCHYWWSTTNQELIWTRDTNYTTQSASESFSYRACACAR